MAARTVAIERSGPAQQADEVSPDAPERPRNLSASGTAIIVGKKARASPMPPDLKSHAPVPCWQSARLSDLLRGKQGENRRGDARHLIGDDHEHSVRQEAQVKVAASANKPQSETIAAAPGKQRYE